MSRSQDIAREMEAARQYLSGSNGIDDVLGGVGLSRLCDDVAPVVTGQGDYKQEHTPGFDNRFWATLLLGVIIGWLSIVALWIFRVV